MDIQKIQDRLRLKGIRLKQDDSAFHLVALNEFVLDGIVSRYNGKRSSMLRSPMDVDSMRAILLEKGVRVASDDPIFICMAINEIVLEDIAGRCRKELNTVDKLFFTIKQPGLCSYLKVVLPLSLVSAGAVVVGHDWVRQGLAVLLGSAIGAGLYLFYLHRDERRGEDTLLKAPPASDAMKWSAAEFDKAVRKALDDGKTLSQRSLEACEAVLVKGEGHEEVADRSGIRRSQLFHALGLLEDQRQQPKRF